MPSISTTLDPAERQRLANICARFSSDFEGERAVAAKKAAEFLRAHNLTWEDLLNASDLSSRSWQDTALECSESGSPFLTEWDVSFLTSLLSSFYDLSPKQEAKLRSIAVKCRVKAW